MEKLEKIGAQVFTVRDFMNTEDDIKRTFERLKKLGYDEIQTAGHPTDGDISYEAYGKLARDAGLDIIGTHDIYEKYRDEFPRALEEHKALGLADNIMGRTKSKPSKPEQITMEEPTLSDPEIKIYSVSELSRHDLQPPILLQITKEEIDYLLQRFYPDAYAKRQNSSPVSPASPTSALGDPVGLVSTVNKVYFECDAHTVECIRAAVDEMDGVRGMIGPIASGDQFISGAAVKEQIVGRFGAICCEMEGGAIAQVCCVNGVKCAVIRSISDNADDDSHSDYGQFTRLAAAHSTQALCWLMEIL